MSKGSFGWEISTEEGRGVVRFAGTCGGEIFLNAMAALFGAPDWDPSFDSVWDLTGVESIDIDMQGIHSMTSLSEELTRIGFTGRVVGVTNDPNHRIFAQLVSARLAKNGRVSRAFDTLQEALRWLDDELAD